jgi:hypothetical protein
MTHTLHREGDRESLKHDFIVLAMPTQGRTTDGSREKLQHFMTIAKKYNPVNMGNSKVGNLYNLPKGFEDLYEETKDGGICHAVYDNPEALIRCLKTLHDEDIGLSITVSGLMDVVGECCKKSGLHRHTVNMSLGIFGKTEKLVPDAEREITTMCGHGMVTGDLVLKTVESIKNGRKTAEKASEELAALCICGIFNTTRCTELLKKMANQ